MDININIKVDGTQPNVDIKKPIVMKRKKNTGGIIQLPETQDQMNRAPGNNPNPILDMIGV